MKKNEVVLLSVLLLILMLGMLGIGLFGKGKKQTESAPVSTPAVTGENAAESTPAPMPEKEYDTVDEVPDKVMNALKKEAETAMLSTRDTYDSLDKGTALNVVLSQDSVAQIVYTLAENGYSAIDYFRNMDMQNPQPLINFGNAVNAGQDAEAAYYVVHTDGSIHANNLVYNNGVGSVITISVEWRDGNPRIYSAGQFSLSEIKYTEKGWLICNRYTGSFDKDGKLGTNPHTFIRLVPYADDKRALSEHYLGSSAYAENNLFTCTWSSNNFGELDFNCLYPILYGQYYGTEQLISSNINALTGYATVRDTNMHIVPYEQFERVIGHFFDIKDETIRAMADNSSSYGGYFILGAQPGFYTSTTVHLPEPEITDYWYNSDGTLTMKIDAVYPWYGTDCAFTHELTVEETKNGFIYVSNYVYESADNIFPDLALKREREAEIATLGE